MTSSEKIISVKGLKVNFWEDGQDNQRTLLLIHGGFGDAYSHWSVAMPMLSENYHILAPDLPGFGKSDLLPHMKTATLLDWIQAFLESQHCDQAVVIGNSFGGVVARLFAAGHPTEVPAVILVNGGAVSDVPGVLRLLEKIPGVSHLIFYLFSSNTTGSGMLNRMLHVKEVMTDDFRLKVRRARGGFVRTMRMLVSSPPPDAQTPLVPTLILWGANDGFTSLDEANAIKDSIAGSTLVEISECGHMPQLETPDVFIWQVDTFLTNLSRPAKGPQQGPQILSNPSG
jgi:pimeloyl-ACP methyl ester carboxylesterase